MNILLIEDDDEKRKKIIDFLNIFFNEKKLQFNVENKKSYHSGLKELVSLKKYNCVLMDMSMPNFDITSSDPEGGSTENFAGRQLLEQMKFRNITYPTIVITQYASFGEYVDKLTLNELKNYLRDNFTPTYIDTIYYSSSESSWQNLLKKELENIIKDIT